MGSLILIYRIVQQPDELITVENPYSSNRKLVGKRIRKKPGKVPMPMMTVSPLLN